MNGFTVKQAEDMRSLMKFSDSVDEDFEKCAALSADAMSALVGAGIGGAMGLAADTIRPADEDEDRWKRRLTSLLAGATLGGIGGYGTNKLVKGSPLLFPDKPSFSSRLGEAVDPDISTLLAAGGLGYGMYPSVTRGGSIYGMFTPGAKEMSGLDLTPEIFKQDAKMRQALKQYESVAGGGKRLAIGRLLEKYIPKKYKKLNFDLPVFGNVTIHTNPFHKRVADADKAATLLAKRIKSKRFLQLFRGAGLNPKTFVPKRKYVEGFAHNASKVLRKQSPHGRALRALALLLGSGAALYKGYDMTH